MLIEFIIAPFLAAFTAIFLERLVLIGNCVWGHHVVKDHMRPQFSGACWGAGIFFAGILILIGILLLKYTCWGVWISTIVVGTILLVILLIKQKKIQEWIQNKYLKIES